MYWKGNTITWLKYFETRNSVITDTSTCFLLVIKVLKKRNYKVFTLIIVRKKKKVFIQHEWFYNHIWLLVLRNGIKILTLFHCSGFSVMWPDVIIFDSKTEEMVLVLMVLDWCDVEVRSVVMYLTYFHFFMPLYSWVLSLRLWFNFIIYCCVIEIYIFSLIWWV